MTRRGRPPTRPRLSAVCRHCETPFTYTPAGRCLPRVYCSQGCWSAACNAARQKLPWDVMVGLYLAGQSTTRIARDHGCSAANLARRLRAMGLTRPRGRPRRAVAA